MSTLSIHPIAGAPLDARYRATVDGNESTGGTPGQALDALIARVGAATTPWLVVVVEPSAESGLSPEQRRRLDELKVRYKAADGGRGTMSADERDEMERLFDAEFAASEERALALARGPMT